MDCSLHRLVGDSNFAQYSRRIILIRILATDLEKCGVYGDPHIQMFHPVNGIVPAFKDCLDDGLLRIVKTSIVTITADVYNYWMVDVCSPTFFISIHYMNISL